MKSKKHPIELAYNAIAVTFGVVVASVLVTKVFIPAVANELDRPNHRCPPEVIYPQCYD